jgi:hypothetical protein
VTAERKAGGMVCSRRFLDMRSAEFTGRVWIPMGGSSAAGWRLYREQEVQCRPPKAECMNRPYRAGQHGSLMPSSTGTCSHSSNGRCMYDDARLSLTPWAQAPLARAHAQPAADRGWR